MQREGGDWRDIPIGLLPERNFATRASDQVGTYGRLRWDSPAYTITAAASNVSAGMFIHPSQNRPISAREAASLQGFDEHYVFAGRVESAYRQVGNAVPPPLARAVAEAVLVCHVRPDQADVWGAPGRIILKTFEQLSTARGQGKISIPVLTPRHRALLVGQSAASARPTTVSVALSAPPRFSAKAADRVAPDPEALRLLRLEEKLPANVRAGRRARAILGYFDGKDPRTLVKHAKVSTSTIRQWVNNFYAGGVEGWRAYHTPVHYLTNDPELQAAIEQAVIRARVRVPVRVATPEGVVPVAQLGRSHMNPYLCSLVERFGDWSVDDLRDMAERGLGRSVGTVYVGDLLAICAVLEDTSQVDRSTLPQKTRITR